MALASTRRFPRERLPASAWLFASVFAGVALRDATVCGDYYTIPGSTYPCGPVTSAPSILYPFKVSVLSPTTFNLDIDDALLQERHWYHPAKCYFAYDPSGYKFYGRLRILGQACTLNNPDIDSCFRKDNFPYPVPPSADMMKMDLSPDPSGSWKALDWGVKFQFSRDGSYQGHTDLEVCAFKSGCQGGEYCVPTFTVVALDPLSWSTDITSPDEWSDTEHLSNNKWDSTNDWSQPHAKPELGPYPPCPEDQDGRALNCHGNETLVISVRKMTINRAEVLSDGSVIFTTSYTLEWGDRYAVHPCTHNLFTIRTLGQQYTVAASTHWSPTFTVSDSSQGSSDLTQSSQFGVNWGFGNPVNESVWDMPIEPPWPKQLILSNSYKVNYFPNAHIEWSMYPFDSQTLYIDLSENSLKPGLLELDISEMQFDHAKVSIGDSWIKESASYELVEVDGKQMLRLSVHVKRDPKGKIYSLFLPVLSIAFFEIAFNTLADFGNTAGVFTTKALTVGVAVSMTNPQTLGFPTSVKDVPFAQACVLMIVVSSLINSLMVLGRIRWERKIHHLSVQIDGIVAKFGSAISVFRIDAAIAREVCSKGKELPEEGPGEGEFRVYHAMVVERKRLKDQLKKYDMLIRCEVLVYYSIASLSIAGNYGVL